ncbi:MAG: hypothetical protein JNL32_04530 [Candidatus Kapabacteria bacterium]|nr:hypothetical protein [Candidatus Kapabacteria bacterium]
MSNTNDVAPPNKIKYLHDIGKMLCSEFGKKEYYTPQEVIHAHRKSKWCDGVDFSSWAMSVFSLQVEFDTYHKLAGAEYQYRAMKKIMLKGQDISSNRDVYDFTDGIDPLLDVHWFDISEIFDGIADGITDSIGDIFNVI